ncbi:ATP binding protein [Aureococcus anophagefferens]|nr:ATP binding protein [Aureococcus anophagefferens]
MFRMLAGGAGARAEFVAALCDPGPGLLVLDEAHRLKEPRSQLYKAMGRIRTRRRVLASGYPAFERPIVDYLEGAAGDAGADGDGNHDGATALRRAYVLQRELEDVEERLFDDGGDDDGAADALAGGLGAAPPARRARPEATGWRAPEVVAREASRAAAQKARDDARREKQAKKFRQQAFDDDADCGEWSGFGGSLRSWARPVFQDGDRAAYDTDVAAHSGKAAVALAVMAAAKRRRGESSPCARAPLRQKRPVFVYRLVAPRGTMEAKVLRQQRRKEL